MKQNSRNQTPVREADAIQKKRRTGVFGNPILLMLLILICLAAAFVVTEYFLSKYGLTVTEYRIRADVPEPIRIVQLSDLHSGSFGKDNHRLIETVAGLEPDLILVTGDMCNADDKDLETVLSLFRRLAELAPLYCSLGNHELKYMQYIDAGLPEQFADAGAAVLEKAYEDITVHGVSLRIGGIYGRNDYYQLHRFGDQAESEFLEDFCDTKRWKLLLCHLPYPWTEQGKAADYSADLVFSGHLHGGQMRLPGIGGLYDPEKGWFPAISDGIWKSYGTHVIISRGLGTSGFPPRMGNIPEIVLVLLTDHESTNYGTE